MTTHNPRLPKPPWLKVKLGQGENYTRLSKLMKGGRLHTVCDEALCPNKGRCWEKGRATLMILGDTCSRSCRFCNVSSEQPTLCDVQEPDRVAGAVKEMGLMDVVITSVTRDDLADGGSTIWAETIQCVKAEVPGISIEILIPDFCGEAAALDRVFATRPDVMGHNLETVHAQYDLVRPQAGYQRSLDVLARSHRAGLITKTGIMVGTGETEDQVHELMHDAVAVGCDILTIGQYLQPSSQHLPVDRYVPPEEFDAYRQAGEAAGFGVVIAAPLVRSSYYSDEQDAYVKARLKKDEA